MLFDFNLDKDEKLYSLYDGYIRGNMFVDLFDSYKDYKIYNVIPNDKEEECKFELMMLYFAINDLNLYLVMHPDNKDVFDKYNYYSNLYKTKEKEYESLYGSLNLEDTKDKYTYLSTPLPWEVKNV